MNTNRKKTLVATFSVLVVLALASGCSLFEDDDDDGPELSIIPNREGTITFTLTDQCRDAGALNARFFGYTDASFPIDGTPIRVSPSNDQVWTTNNDRTTGESIVVTLGDGDAGIGVWCYGAELRGDRDGSYWGVGLDGNQGCSDCCYRVPASGNVQASRDLICN